MDTDEHGFGENAPRRMAAADPIPRSLIRVHPCSSVVPEKSAVGAE